MSAKSQEIAMTILSQMGGQNRLKAMTGAKNFVAHESGVSFRIPSTRNMAQRINYVKVTLNSMDLYDIEYGYIRGVNYTTKRLAGNIYNDMLKKDFEKTTGLYLTL